MDFQTAVKTCFNKYADFSGRAARSEFWWFALFTFAVSLVLNFIWEPLGGLWGLAVLLPSVAVGVRRLHDRGMTGWWYLLILIPFLGALVLLFFFVQKGDDGPNEYGADPLT